MMKKEGEERREEREGRGRDVGSETGGRIFQFFYTVLAHRCSKCWVGIRDSTVRDK